MNTIIKISILRIVKDKNIKVDGQFLEVNFKNGMYVLLNNSKLFDKYITNKTQLVDVEIKGDINEVINNLRYRITKEKLNPIEFALLFGELAQIMGVSQNNLAKALNQTQGNISNKKRLLKLPLYIQQAIIQDKITERHGRAFLQLVQNPAYENIIKDVFDDVMLKKLKVSETEILINKKLGKEERKEQQEIEKLNSKRDIRSKIAIPAINQIESDMEKTKQLIEKYYPQLKLELNMGTKNNDYIIELKIKDIK